MQTSSTIAQVRAEETKIKQKSRVEEQTYIQKSKEINAKLSF